MARCFMRSAVAILTVSQALAAQAEHLTLPVPATNVQQMQVDYQCETLGRITVSYINAGPNSLAVVPVEGQSLVFAAVISGSGARYAAGPYIWWSHQGDATLDDVRDAEGTNPVKCTGVK
ncbi:MAG: MliC family protein [Alphaproteobacteria bacterium]|nr:MliC family protein [Alphaproteobacteria bacterium]